MIIYLRYVFPSVSRQVSCSIRVSVLFLLMFCFVTSADTAESCTVQVQPCYWWYSEPCVLCVSTIPPWCRNASPGRQLRLANLTRQHRCLDGRHRQSCSVFHPPPCFADSSHILSSLSFASAATCPSDSARIFLLSCSVYVLGKPEPCETAMSVLMLWVTRSSRLHPRIDSDQSGR